MYKIIHNNKIIDVVKYPSFIKFLPTGHIAFVDKGSAQGVLGSDAKTIYSFKAIAGKSYPVATLEKICDNEFKRLVSLLNSGQEISADESSLEKAKQAKIKKLSGMCKNSIIEGFSIVLSAGNTSSAVPVPT